jgi:hypothetical protein
MTCLCDLECFVGGSIKMEYYFICSPWYNHIFCLKRFFHDNDYKIFSNHDGANVLVKACRSRLVHHKYACRPLDGQARTKYYSQFVPLSGLMLIIQLKMLKTGVVNRVTNQQFALE